VLGLERKGSEEKRRDSVMMREGAESHMGMV